MTPADGDGDPRCLAPAPIPSRWLVLDREERYWRARAAINLWLMGFSHRAAWSVALSTDPAWVAYIRNGFTSLSVDRLYVLVLQRRLAAIRDSQTVSSPT